MIGIMNSDRQFGSGGQKIIVDSRIDMFQISFGLL